MTDNAEVVAVLVAGLMIFIGIMRYVTVYTKSADQRRLEFLKLYEDALIENAKLRGRVSVQETQEIELKKTITKYRNLYQKTLDTPNKPQ